MTPPGGDTDPPAQCTAKSGKGRVNLLNCLAEGQTSFVWPGLTGLDLTTLDDAEVTTVIWHTGWQLARVPFCDPVPLRL